MKICLVSITLNVLNDYIIQSDITKTKLHFKVHTYGKIQLLSSETMNVDNNRNFIAKNNIYKFVCLLSRTIAILLYVYIGVPILCLFL